jgi:hypothetical protein
VAASIRRSSDVVGSTTTLDGQTVTIVGVAPASLRFPATAEFWQPLIFKPRDLAPGARGAQWVQVLARLKPTVSAGQATIALQTVADSLATEFPQTEKTRRCPLFRCTSGLFAAFARPWWRYSAR